MTNDEIHAEIERLIDEDRFEEAVRLADRLAPITKEAFVKILHDAPVDDEPVTSAQLDRLDAADAAIERLLASRVRQRPAV